MAGGPGGVSVGKASVRVLPDTGKFRSSLQAYLDRTEKSLRLKVPVEAEADEKSAATAGKRLSSVAQNSAGEVDVSVDLDATNLAADARAAVSAAQAAAGDIDVRMNVSTAGAAISSMMAGGAGIGSMVGTVARLGAVAGTATVAVAGLAAPIAAVGAAAYSAVAPLVGLTAAMAVPAIAGAGVAFGTLKMSLSGMGDAINAADPQELADALAELPPSAQDAAMSMRDLKDSFTGMTDEVKSNFWANFSNIGDLSATVEPLRTAMTGLAADFGNAAAGVVAFVSSGTGLEAFTTLVSSGASSMANLGYAVAGVIPGIISVGAAASPVLEDLTSGINQAAEAWSTNMVAALESGDLEAKFQGAADSARAIWAVMQDLGGIIGGVFSAMSAGAGGAAGALAEGLSSLNQWVNSGPGMQTLTNFFTEMYGAVQTLLPILGQIGGIILGTVAPAIAQFIQAVGPGLSDVVASLGDALAGIAPALGPLGSMLGSVLSSLAPMAPAIAGVAAGFAVFSKVAPIISTVMSVVSGLGPVFAGLSLPITAVVAGVGLLIAAFTQVPGAGAALGGAFSTIMSSLGPVIDLVMQFVGSLVDALVPVAAALIPVITQIATTFSQIMTALTPIIAIIFELATTIISALVPVFTSLLPIVTMVISVFGNIVTAIAPVIAIVLRVVGVFLQLLAAIIGFVASALGMIASFVAGVIAGFVSMVSTVIGTVTGWVASIIGFFADLVSSAVNKAVELWNSVTSAFSSGVSRAINFVSELPGKALSALGDLGSLLVDSGKALIQGFIDGIKAMFGAVKDAASSVVGAVRDFFPFSPAKEGPFSGHGWVLYSGRSVGEAFSKGMEDRRNMVGKSATSLMKAATGNLDQYKADVGLVMGSNGAMGGAPLGGIDTSVHIGQMVAADPEVPLRTIATRQKMAEIKAGLG